MSSWMRAMTALKERADVAGVRECLERLQDAERREYVELRVAEDERRARIRPPIRLNRPDWGRQAARVHLPGGALGDRLSRQRRRRCGARG
jgi:hypothetical protein